MKQTSRTKSSIKNMLLATIAQIVTIFSKFFVQTVFIKFLGSEYLGLNGLYTNILTMLSLAELGVGNAIIFSMYKPIAKNDIEKVKSLSQLYKKSYTIIGAAIFLIGVCLIPFLPFIIKDIPSVKENVVLIYFLFLINSAVSYFWTYKKSIIFAHQKNYIVSFYSMIFLVLRSVFQCVFLIVTKNYILFLIIMIIFTILENFAVSIQANKLFPYLKERKVDKLNKKEQKNIFTNIRALLFYKVGTVILTGTDNILMSSMLGTAVVGIVSNYTLIINALSGIVNQALTGFTASIGSLNATGDKVKEESIFYQLFFISFWIYSYISICLFILLNDFITLWIGMEYVLPIGTVLVIVLNAFFDGIRFASYTYRTTLGLFVKGKYVPLIESVINIIVSIILCKIFGLLGIILGTIIARALTVVWFDPYLIYKYEFKKNPIKFYGQLLKYLMIFSVTLILTYLVICKLAFTGIFGFIAKGIICTIVCNVIFILFFFKTQEFKDVKEKIVFILKKVER